MRERFEEKLNKLRDEILTMGSIVEDELSLALKALKNLDSDLVPQIYQMDKTVNSKRFAIEAECLALIATQQPAAQDLRSIVAVMNMIVDLERMGDQAKGIGKVIPHIAKYPSQKQPAEINKMGDLAGDMIRQVMAAYTAHNVDMARQVIAKDDTMDELYARLFTQIMHQMAETAHPGKVEASYEIIRTARELERFGDLATNIAERIIYISTGHAHEGNVDPDVVLEQSFESQPEE